MEMLSRAITGFKERVVEYLDPSGLKWSKNEFDHYLKQLIKGRESLAFLDDYPKRIALFRTWHDILNDLRQKAKLEHKERFGVVGYTSARDKVYIQTNGFIGEEGRVSAEVLQRTIDAAKRRGIIKHFGAIHSHPRSGASISDNEGFSVPDLFSLVIPDGEFFTIVVEPTSNFVAFRSFETVNVPSGPFVLTGESFSRYWYEQCGYEYSGPSRYGTTLYPSFFREQRNIVEAIAQRHKLAIYRGEPNRSLARVFP